MKTDIIKKADSRIYYLDVLRFIACIAVVLAQTSAIYVIENFGSANYVAGTIVNSISRIGVPLFVMISGSLFLDEEYEYSNEKMKHHIGRMIIFFVIWSLFYTILYEVVRPYLAHESISLSKVFGTFIKGSTHLWFVYMIVGIYLILPLLRLWVKKENKKQVEYFLILAILFTFAVPQLSKVGSNFSTFFTYIDDIITNTNLKYVGGYTAYFILGWYLHNFDFKNRTLLYAFGLMSMFFTVWATLTLSLNKGEDIRMYGNLTINILAYSSMIFVIVKTLFKNTKKENEFKLVKGVSKCSLGIYAIHPFAISAVSMVLEKVYNGNALINIPVIFIATFAVSFLISFIVSKIPLFKKIV